jgi:hypothetical protein
MFKLQFAWHHTPHVSSFPTAGIIGECELCCTHCGIHLWTCVHTQSNLFRMVALPVHQLSEHGLHLCTYAKPAKCVRAVATATFGSSHEQFLPLDQNRQSPCSQSCIDITSKPDDCGLSPSSTSCSAPPQGPMRRCGRWPRLKLVTCGQHLAAPGRSGARRSRCCAAQHALVDELPIARCRARRRRWLRRLAGAAAAAAAAAKATRKTSKQAAPRPHGVARAASAVARAAGGARGTDDICVL